jgi:hypothetical protein
MKRAAGAHRGTPLPPGRDSRTSTASPANCAAMFTFPKVAEQGSPPGHQGSGHSPANCNEPIVITAAAAIVTPVSSAVVLRWLRRKYQKDETASSRKLARATSGGTAQSSPGRRPCKTVNATNGTARIQVRRRNDGQPWLPYRNRSSTNQQTAANSARYHLGEVNGSANTGETARGISRKTPRTMAFAGSPPGRGRISRSRARRGPPTGNSHSHPRSRVPYPTARTARRSSRPR